MVRIFKQAEEILRAEGGDPYCKLEIATGVIQELGESYRCVLGCRADEVDATGTVTARADFMLRKRMISRSQREEVMERLIEFCQVDISSSTMRTLNQDVRRIHAVSDILGSRESYIKIGALDGMEKLLTLHQVEDVTSLQTREISLGIIGVSALGSEADDIPSGPGGHLGAARATPPEKIGLPDGLPAVEGAILSALGEVRLDRIKRLRNSVAHTGVLFPFDRAILGELQEVATMLQGKAIPEVFPKVKGEIEKVRPRGRVQQRTLQGDIMRPKDPLLTSDPQLGKVRHGKAKIQKRAR